MRKRKVADGIYHLQADTNKELALTFMRFQEHYESPQFRNKVFTVSEFKDWYKNQYGSFSYVSDWSGFNIPSYILNPFQAGLFDPLTKAERALIRLFDRIAHPFYIIGTSRESPTDVHHELAHALYHLDSAYRRKVNAILSQANLKRLRKWLLRKGYTGEVVLDECNAYLTHDVDLLESEGIDCKPVAGHVKKLKRLFERHLQSAKHVRA